MKVLNEPVLSYLIKRSYSYYGFTSAFIYGPQGVGKTTYAMKVLYHIYGSWDEALKHTYFTLDELRPVLEQAVEERQRLRAILLDDAGISLQKLEWYSKPSIWFGKLFNLARSVAGGIIFTSVEASDIIKYVRDKVSLRVQIRRLGPNRAKAVGYRLYYLPDLTPHIKRYFRDDFTLELPTFVRSTYEEKRHETLKKLMRSRPRKPQLPVPDLDRALGALED